MPTAFKFPFRFDTAALKYDLAQLGDDEWTPHFNPQYYEGMWSGVALRAVSGATFQLLADASKSGVYTDTAILHRCGYFREVLGAFKCSLETVRLLKLATGSRILEHRDFDLGFKWGVVRVHVPVQTDAGVEFLLDGEPVEMREGECWYLDLSLPHRVNNQGKTDRVHLVIDCVVNEWLESTIKGGGSIY